MTATDSRPLSIDEVIASAAGAPECVRVERPGPDRAVVTLDDPEKLNVLSAALTVQLKAALERLTADSAVRTIVITGSGRGFCAGGDLRLMRNAVGRLHASEDVDGSTGPWRFIRRQFGGIVRLLTTSDAAVVAAVNGAAAGVGLAFVLASDIVVLSERAVLVPAFGRLGLLPEVGTSWLMTRRLGYQRAFARYVEGGHIGAEEALRLGLANEVVPHDELLAAAGRWADRIAALPPHAAPMGKALMRGAADMSWEQALLGEELAEPNCFTTRGFADRVEEMLGR
jgi:2-(1,2-epoxy-1,2-dihydrophenyl)acetyl-CoA isomerase